MCSVYISPSHFSLPLPLPLSPYSSLPPLTSLPPPTLPHLTSPHLTSPSPSLMRFESLITCTIQILFLLPPHTNDTNHRADTPHIPFTLPHTTHHLTLPHTTHHPHPSHIPLTTLTLPHTIHHLTLHNSCTASHTVHYINSFIPPQVTATTC